MQADILREKFLDFFKSRKHKIVDSDSLIPNDDPTVLFTPAGMNQFKKQFLGRITDFTRAATAQRCLRTDDLDKVGHTPGHHTFFEMLGNFSFGDYFKKEAIRWAWEFLTEELKIKKDKLWVSVYKDDDQAYKVWSDLIKVPKEKIIRLGDKENFWPSEAKEKGPNGPCGECSEIFFDSGEDKGCKSADCDPSCACGRFVEVWNLVFTQFNRKAGGILEPLPQKNIDTGMGLERLTAVMQDAPNNFETDLFRPLIKEIKSAVILHPADEKELIYAIADHIRAITFAIYDGVLPSNEKRGYVIKKLIRISTSHIARLGIKPPFLYKLAPLVSNIMKNPYPDLDLRKEDIAQVILAYENKLISTRQNKHIIADFRLLREDRQKAAEKAFELYDTYGWELEEIEKIFEKENIKFPKEGFLKEMERQRLRSRSQSAMKGDVFSSEDLKLDAPATKFLGYKESRSYAKILKIIKDKREVKNIAKGDEARLILDKSVFYPESGGQVGDAGELIKGKNVFEVIDTQKKDKVIIHIGKVKEGNFKKADSVLSKINAERRLSIARNHTATHLLQAALRNILGSHVQQQGSLVSSDKLRFDFTHFKDISVDEIDRIEEMVNDYIINNHALVIKQMPLPAAKRRGALAFFAEKYEDKVRVVYIGDFSKELCAGTHLSSTDQVGLFKITHEGSVASGVRRIEALTGKPAFKMIKDQENILKEVSLMLNVPREKISGELEKKSARIKELEKQLSSQKLSLVKSCVNELIENAQRINNIKLIVKDWGDSDMSALRSCVDLIKQKTESCVIVMSLTTNFDTKVVIGITSDLCEKGLDAAKLISDVAKEIGGSGGGRKDFAQAGGGMPERLPKALEELKNMLRNFKQG